MDKRYDYFKSEITDLYVIIDTFNKKTFSGMANEYNCKKIVDELNNQRNIINKLKENNDIKFWKLQFMRQFNETQLITHEISRAVSEGYKVSDKFQKYLDSLKKFNEEKMKEAEEQEKW